MNIKNLILFISIVTLASCKSSHFIHKNGTKKIELIIPNNEIVLKTRADYYKEHKFYDLRVTYSDNGEQQHHTFKIPLTRKNK